MNENKEEVIDLISDLMNNMTTFCREEIADLFYKTVMAIARGEKRLHLEIDKENWIIHVWNEDDDEDRPGGERP